MFFQDQIAAAESTSRRLPNCRREASCAPTSFPGGPFSHMTPPCSCRAVNNFLMVLRMGN